MSLFPYAFTVPGPAVPQGRPRFTRSGHVYTPKNSRDYRYFIRLCAVEALLGRDILDGPIRVRITEYRAVPKSWSKRKREKALAGYIRPTTRPDLDNIIKAVLDALNGLVWIDDRQITGLTAFKFYSDEPRVIVEVEPL